MRRAGTAIAAAGLLAALAGGASAQERKSSGQVNLGGGSNQVGEYSGVEPGEGAPPGGRPRRGKYPLVTWIGFQPQEGGSSRVFIQLDRDVSHQETVRGGALVVTLPGARYANRNARRFLDTRFFDSAVERITTQPVRRKKGSRAGVEIAIRFKNAADARAVAPTLSTGKDGMTYIMFEIPAGSGAPASSPAPSSSDPE